MLFWGITLFLLATLGVGLWASFRIQGDSENYLVAGRRLTLPLAAATLTAQSVDANATLGNMDLASEFGFWAGAALPMGLATCLFLTGLFFAKPMNELQLVTLPDFYRHTYGRRTEVIASIVMVVSFGFLLAGNLVAGGYLFEAFFDTSYTVGVLLIAGFVLVYTATGGLFAVAYTDAFQIVIAVVGTALLFFFITGNYELSWADGMGPLAVEQLLDPAAGAYINWASLLALGFGDIVAIDFMARIFAADSPRVAQRACFIGATITLFVGLPLSMLAISAPAILTGANVTYEGPILFGLIQGIVPQGIGLIVLMAILCASLSTADGAILGTSSVIAHNILGVSGAGGPEASRKLLRTTRMMAVLITALGIGFALRVPQTGTLLLLAFDIGFAALLIPLIGGIYWKGIATASGAIGCIVAGTVTRLVLFVLCPHIYGVDNTLLYLENNFISADFDGLPTFISPLVGAVAYLLVPAVLRPFTAKTP